jgi:hypothetical protein
MKRRWSRPLDGVFVLILVTMAKVARMDYATLKVQILLL